MSKADDLARLVAEYREPEPYTMGWSRKKLDALAKLPPEWLDDEIRAWEGLALSMDDDGREIVRRVIADLREQFLNAHRGRSVTQKRRAAKNSVQTRQSQKANVYAKIKERYETLLHGSYAHSGAINKLTEEKKWGSRSTILRALGLKDRKSQ